MKTILIVDDSMFTRNIHQRIVEGAGYETITASGGAEAISMYADRRPDMVTLDLLMPDMDGMDALRQIIAIDPSARVVICSTDKQKYRREEAEAGGASGFIAKPVDPEELVALMRRLLSAPGRVDSGEDNGESI